MPTCDAIDSTGVDAVRVELVAIEADLSTEWRVSGGAQGEVSQAQCRARHWSTEEVNRAGLPVVCAFVARRLCCVADAARVRPLETAQRQLAVHKQLGALSEAEGTRVVVEGGRVGRVDRAVFTAEACDRVARRCSGWRREPRSEQRRASGEAYARADQGSASRTFMQLAFAAMR